MDRQIWNQIVKENMDLTDRDTLTVMTTINEADQNQVVAALASRLYDSIVKKVTDIDFGTIPNSRGDITKIPNYLELTQCLTDMREMLLQNKQSTDSTDIVFTAIDNIKKLTPIWSKGYNIECELVVIMYNTLALSVVSSTSILLSSMIEFIKEPGSAYEMSLVKVKKNNSKDNLLFKNLKKFNEACKKGSIEKTLSDVLSAQRAVRENNNIVTESIFSTIMTTVTLLSLATLIIPIMHELVSFAVCAKQKVSDYLSAEADIIRLNAEKVNYDRSKSEDAKKKIVAKQLKIADKFKAWSNKLAVKITKANTDATKMVEAESSVKYKADDLLDEIPDSAIF